MIESLLLMKETDKTKKTEELWSYDTHGFRGNVEINPTGLMAYDPMSNTFFIGPMVRTLYDKGDLATIDFAALHEDDHRRYFELNQNDQELLARAVLLEIQNNSEFWNAIIEFATILYSQANYKQLHTTAYREYIVEDPKKRGAKKFSDGSLGMTNIYIKTDENKFEELTIHLGMFITELLSYMSVSQSKSKWEKLKKTGHDFAGLATTAKKCSEIASLELKKVFARCGFGVGRLIPNWKKDINFT